MGCYVAMAVSAIVQSEMTVQVFDLVFSFSGRQVIVLSQYESAISESIESQLRHEVILVVAELFRELVQHEAPGSVRKLLVHEVFLSSVVSWSLNARSMFFIEVHDVQHRNHVVWAMLLDQGVEVDLHVVRLHVHDVEPVSHPAMTSLVLIHVMRHLIN